MTSRERGNAIFEHRNTDGPAFWTGHPNDRTIPLHAQAWGIDPTREAIYRYLDDDCRWFPANGHYFNEEGVPSAEFDMNWGHTRTSINADGPLAEAETLADIRDYPWPRAENLDFAPVYAELEKHADKLVFTGAWSCFYHVVADLFGMENYFVKMYENPMIVEAVTEKVVDYYVEANERFYAGLGDRNADVMFFGNDFGTQRDLQISPECFRRFVLPSTKRILATGKRYGKKIMLHSCGSIRRVIPDLIDAGVDALHPIQAGAAGMDADSLAQFKNDIAFVGGINAQSFLVESTPEQIARETVRVWNTLGPNIILSPSHEEILPNVPAANLKAISDTAHRLRGERPGNV